MNLLKDVRVRDDFQALLTRFLEALEIVLPRPEALPYTGDAKTLGLAGKDNWKKQPATMLKWRAVSACARVVFPDVIQGMYTPEEIGQDTEQVEVAFVDEEPDRVPLSSPDPPREETLDKALASRLHRALGGMGLSHGQQQLLATAIAKRRIESFTELTIMESKSVHSAGSTLADGSASTTD